VVWLAQLSVKHHRVGLLDVRVEPVAAAGCAVEVVLVLDIRPSVGGVDGLHLSVEGCLVPLCVDLEIVLLRSDVLLVVTIHLEVVRVVSYAVVEILGCPGVRHVECSCSSQVAWERLLLDNLLRRARSAVNLKLLLLAVKIEHDDVLIGLLGLPLVLGL